MKLIDSFQKEYAFFKRRKTLERQKVVLELDIEQLKHLEHLLRSRNNIPDFLWIGDIEGEKHSNKMKARAVKNDPEYAHVVMLIRKHYEKLSEVQTSLEQLKLDKFYFIHPEYGIRQSN